MKKLTLQCRITILTALVLLICTATLTTISIHNAEPLYSLASDDSEADVIENYDFYDSLEPIELTPIPAQLAKKEFDGKSILYCSIFPISLMPFTGWISLVPEIWEGLGLGFPL